MDRKVENKSIFGYQFGDRKKRQNFPRQQIYEEGIWRRYKSLESFGFYTS